VISLILCALVNERVPKRKAVMNSFFFMISLF
jgi:hypothetical protein